MAPNLNNGNLVILGDVCHDLPLHATTVDHESGAKLGGAVSFSSAVASILGVPTHAFTMAPQTHPRWRDFQQYGHAFGFQTTNLALSHTLGGDKITSFANTYVGGKRTQDHPSKTQQIGMEQLPFILPHLNSESQVLIGTVTSDEVSLDLLRALHGTGVPISMTMQGYFRRVHPDSKRVTEGPFANWRHVASLVDAIYLSDEDLRFPDGDYLLRDLVHTCPQVVLTRGGNGVSIYQNRSRTDIPSVPLTPEQIGTGASFTGAGETFTTAKMAYTMQGLTPIEAATKAHLFAACKIHFDPKNPKIDGVPSIPTPQEFEAWTQSPQVLKYVRDLGMPHLLQKEGILTLSERR